VKPRTLCPKPSRSRAQVTDAIAEGESPLAAQLRTRLRAPLEDRSADDRRSRLGAPAEDQVRAPAEDDAPAAGGGTLAHLQRSSSRGGQTPVDSQPAAGGAHSQPAAAAGGGSQRGGAGEGHSAGAGGGALVRLQRGSSRGLHPPQHAVVSEVSPPVIVSSYNRITQLQAWESQSREKLEKTRVARSGPLSSEYGK